MSRHLVTITHDSDDWSHSIACPDGNGCSGWIECDHRGQHEGHDGDFGPYDDINEHQIWFDIDEVAFHGVTHTWRSGYGWTVPYDGCVVQGFDIDVSHLAHLPDGTYAVEDDWDDTECHLLLIGPQETA